MADSFRPGSFEDFVRWLTGRGPEPARGLEESRVAVLEAARHAWRDFHAVERSHRAELVERVRAGVYYEELELLAAADVEQKRRLPRLRTPNGFAVSALYAGDSASGAAPVAVLVECPEDFKEVFIGLKVRVLCAGQWVVLGEIDVDGKAMGDLPPGVEFKPPLGLRVGEMEERPEEILGPDVSR